MNRLISFLEHFDPRVLMLGFALLCAVGFAVVQMTGAFDSKEEQPAYRNHPAPAFAPASSDQLVSENYLRQQRLPDDDYQTVFRLAKTLLDPAVKLKLNQAALEAAGEDRITASNESLDLSTLASTLSGRTAQITSPLTLKTGNGVSATLQAGAGYSATPNGDPPVDATVNFNFSSDGDGTWQLTHLTVVPDGGGLDTPSAGDGGSVPGVTP